MTIPVYVLTQLPEGFRVTDTHGSVWEKTNPSTDALWKSEDRTHMPDSVALEFLFGPLTVTPPKRDESAQPGSTVRSLTDLDTYLVGTVVVADRQAWMKVGEDIWQNAAGLRTNGAGLFNDQPRLLHLQEHNDA